MSAFSRRFSAPSTVVLVTDALCRSSDETHDALMELNLWRFSEQVEVARTAEILDALR